jgi:hypothetical protein
VWLAFVLMLIMTKKKRRCMLGGKRLFFLQEYSQYKKFLP